jgi:hypothetical protein
MGVMSRAAEFGNNGDKKAFEIKIYCPSNLTDYRVTDYSTKNNSLFHEKDIPHLSFPRSKALRDFQLAMSVGLVFPHSVNVVPVNDKQILPSKIIPTQN